jgi:hypothetical protein
VIIGPYPYDFNDLAVRFGPFTIDLFATGLNAKCNRFYTRSAEEGSCGVDAFAQRWEGKRVYAAPPVSLALRTIRKAANVILGGVLIVPLWKSAKFWTVTFDDDRHLSCVFAGMQIVRMRELAWEITARDRLGGHKLQFLVLCFKEGKVEQPLESLQGEGRCFRILFNNSCECSK